MTWTPERHAAAKALCENATKGPWASTDDGSVEIIVDGVDADGHRFTAYPELVASANSLDAEFIAAARTGLPDALAEIERLQAELDRYWRVINQALDIYDIQRFRDNVKAQEANS